MKILYLSIMALAFLESKMLKAQAWCVGCVSADQMQTSGILIPLSCAAAVVGVWFFLFRHFKD